MGQPPRRCWRRSDRPHFADHAVHQDITVCVTLSECLELLILRFLPSRVDFAHLPFHHHALTAKVPNHSVLFVELIQRHLGFLCRCGSMRASTLCQTVRRCCPVIG